MKILIANDTYHPDVNGCSYFTHRLAQYLKNKGHSILVVAPSTSFFTEYADTDGVDVFRVRSVPVIVQKGFRVVVPIGINRKVEKAILDFSPDVVHVQGHFALSSAVIKASKKHSLPIVGTNHFMPENLVHYLHLPKKLEDVIKSIAWTQFRNVFENLDHVTSPTKTAARLVKKTGFSRDVKPISNGIDLKKFHPSNDGKHIKDKYGLPDAPIFLFVGRLDKEKNVDILLKAIAKIPKNIPMHFAVAGKGKMRESLEKLADKLKIRDKVTFLGFVPDKELPYLYGAADCFVIACEAELQSIATMEAMATGLPVIAVDAMALPELVHHGKNGYLFDLDDRDSLALHIQRMSSDESLRKNMAQKSLEIIASHDIDKAIEEFESIYRDLAKKQ